MYYLIKSKISSNNLNKYIIFKIPKSLNWPTKSPNPPKLFSVPLRMPPNPQIYLALITLPLDLPNPQIAFTPFTSSSASTARRRLDLRLPCAADCRHLSGMSSLRYVLFSRILSPSLRSATMASRNCFKISINVCMNHEIERATTLLSCWLQETFYLL